MLLAGWAAALPLQCYMCVCDVFVRVWNEVLIARLGINLGECHIDVIFPK